MKCPICNKPTTWKDNPTRPFCSERCKMIDFGGWINEEYNVPAQEETPSFEEMNPHSELSDENPRRQSS